MEGFFWLLILGGLITLWVVAAVKLFQFGKPGVRYFFNCLLLMLVISTVLFILIVFPVLDCAGMLCGLGSALLFMGLCFVQVITFPLVMLTKGVSKLRLTAKEEEKRNAPNDELLDS